jgi:hypothetical protein
MFRRLRERAFEVLLSVYLYNEQRGFTYLDQLALAFAEKYPQDREILASIRKHAADERNHYRLFCRYFQRRELLPFRVGRKVGYCDQIVKALFRRDLSEIDPRQLLEHDADFFRLCRLIMITEMRGMKQVDLILQNFLVRARPELLEIFQVVKRDEPSHCFPYQAWLRRHGQHEPSTRETIADSWVHHSLMWIKLPLLFLNPFLKRGPFPVPPAAL